MPVETDGSIQPREKKSKDILDVLQGDRDMTGQSLVREGDSSCDKSDKSVSCMYLPIRYGDLPSVMFSKHNYCWRRGVSNPGG